VSLQLWRGPAHRSTLHFTLGRGGMLVVKEVKTLVPVIPVSQTCTSFLSPKAWDKGERWTDRSPTMRSNLRKENIVQGG